MSVSDPVSKGRWVFRYSQGKRGNRWREFCIWTRTDFRLQNRRCCLLRSFFRDSSCGNSSTADWRRAKHPPMPPRWCSRSRRWELTAGARATASWSKNYFSPESSSTNEFNWFSGRIWARLPLVSRPLPPLYILSMHAYRYGYVPNLFTKPDMVLCHYYLVLLFNGNVLGGRRTTLVCNICTARGFTASAVFAFAVWAMRKCYVREKLCYIVHHHPLITIVSIVLALADRVLLNMNSLIFLCFNRLAIIPLWIRRIERASRIIHLCVVPISILALFF